MEVPRPRMKAMEGERQTSLKELGGRKAGLFFFRGRLVVLGLRVVKG